MENKTKDNLKENDNIIDLKEKQKIKRFSIGSILLLLFMMLYVPSLIHWLSKDNINSEILRIGVIEESTNVEGLLVRDEILLDPSNRDGNLVRNVSEGERIPAFYTVATISDKTSPTLLEKLDEVNNKIIKAQNERANKKDFFSEDMAKIDESIGLKVQDIVWKSKSNSLNELKQLKADIDELMQKKAEIAGDSENDPIVNSLKTKRNQIQQQINMDTSKIISKYSGIVSYTIDGYENILTPKSLSKITFETFDKIKSNTSVNKSDDNIQVGKHFIKVIKGTTTIIVVVLDSQKADAFKAGDTVNVRLNEFGVVIPGMVKEIDKKSDKKSMLAITINRYAEELSSFRKINIDIISKSVEGLKIPVKCLYSYDKDWKNAKVMLIKANCAVQRDVVVLGRDNEYAIIKSPDDEVKKTVSLYDTYILNPENVKEGQIILK